MTKIGQVVSDVSGVLCGGALERFLTRMHLIRAPNLTSAQRQLPIARNVSTAGAVLGVIAGCALGATTLLLVDLEARDRIERASRLREIVNDMIAPNVHSSFQCDSCTVYVTSTKDLTLPVQKQQHDDNNNKAANRPWKTVLRTVSETDADSVVRRCAEHAEFVVADDRQVMYAPVIKQQQPNTTTTADDDEPEVMAVVAFTHGGGGAGNSSGFCDEDIVTARVMARHIAIFMDRLAD